jgi:hypothetical protein
MGFLYTNKNILGTFQPLGESLVRAAFPAPSHLDLRVENGVSANIDCRDR